MVAPRKFEPPLQVMATSDERGVLAMNAIDISRESYWWVGPDGPAYVGHGSGRLPSEFREVTRDDGTVAFIAPAWPKSALRIVMPEGFTGPVMELPIRQDVPRTSGWMPAATVPADDMRVAIARATIATAADGGAHVAYPTSIGGVPGFVFERDSVLLRGRTPLEIVDAGSHLRTNRSAATDPTAIFAWEVYLVVGPRDQPTAPEVPFDPDRVRMWFVGTESSLRTWLDGANLTPIDRQLAAREPLAGRRQVTFSSALPMLKRSWVGQVTSAPKWTTRATVRAEYETELEPAHHDMINAQARALASPGDTPRVRWRVCAMTGPLTAAAVSARSISPPTAAELTAALSMCPDFKPASWPVVDQLHDRLIAEWRALAPAESTASNQRSLESRFADDLAAVTGISAECVSALKLVLEESRLRRRLAEMRIETCIPSVDEVVGTSGPRLRPEVAGARAASVHALRALVADAERTIAAGGTPMSSSVFAPSEVEMAAVRSVTKCIDALRGVSEGADARRMRERLSAAIARFPRDLPMARAAVILRFLPGLDAEQSGCARAWLDAECARRVAALEELASRVTEGDADQRQLTQLLHAGTGPPAGLAELLTCLPEGTAREVQALVGHWDALLDPVSTARTLVGDQGVSGLLVLDPANVMAVSKLFVVDVLVQAPDDDPGRFQALWSSILGRELHPAERERVGAAFAAWQERLVPKLRRALAAVSADRREADPDASAAAAQAWLASSAAQSEAVRAIVSAEGQLEVDFPAEVVPSGAQSLARVERLAEAFAAIPLSHVATVGMQYPHPVSPRAAIEDAGLSQADRTSAIRICVEHGDRLLREYRELVRTVMEAHVCDGRRALDQAENRPAGPECGSGVRVAWDAWLWACERVRNELRSSLPVPACDAIMARWMVACFPVLRDLADMRDLPGTAPQDGRARSRTLLASSVRELESIAFANRPASDPGPPSAEVARITTVFQQLQFDVDTLRERECRERMVR
ncbi:MAG: hypothetical protein FGM39_04095 [Phycisphaerales bacterium]|nr:hypothetical protein [Phycisphaerales bacterium]